MNRNEHIKTSYYHLKQDKRKNKNLADIIDHGIVIYENYGYVRATKYLYQKGVEWSIIQRVLDGNLKRKR